MWPGRPSPATEDPVCAHWRPPASCSLSSTHGSRRGRAEALRVCQPSTEPDGEQLPLPYSQRPPTIPCSPNFPLRGPGSRSLGLPHKPTSPELAVTSNLNIVKSSFTYQTGKAPRALTASEQSKMDTFKLLTENFNWKALVS